MPQPKRIREVEMGDHVYTVVPQRRGRIDHDLQQTLVGLQGIQLQGGNPLHELGSGAYAVLKVLIDDLMPEWEYDGYPTKEAWERGRDGYVEAADRSPTYDEIVEAIDACLWVNRLDLLKTLGKLLGTEFLEVASRKVVADFLTSTSPSSSSPRIPSTTSTTGTTTPPTSDPGGTSSPTPTTPTTPTDESGSHETTEPAASAV